MKLCKKSNVTNSQRAIAIFLPSAQKIIAFLSHKTKVAEFFVHFVGKKKIAHLHAQYFDDPTPTDCITFPYDDPHFLGEIFVCPKVAEEYAKKHNGDIAKEITLYIVHGFLHLLGYDDKTPEMKKIMRKEEKKWMHILAKNHLGIKIENNANV